MSAKNSLENIQDDPMYAIKSLPFEPMKKYNPYQIDDQPRLPLPKFTINKKRSKQQKIKSDKKKRNGKEGGGGGGGGGFGEGENKVEKEIGCLNELKNINNELRYDKTIDFDLMENYFPYKIIPEVKVKETQKVKVKVKDIKKKKKNKKKKKEKEKEKKKEKEKYVGEKKEKKVEKEKEEEVKKEKVEEKYCVKTSMNYEYEYNISNCGQKQVGGEEDEDEDEKEKKNVSVDSRMSRMEKYEEKVKEGSECEEKKYLGKICFVTGGTGFIGMNLVEEIIIEERFQMVVCLVRKNSKRLKGLKQLIKHFGKNSRVKVKIEYGDIVDAESIENSMPENTDCVFHLAALVDVSNKDTPYQRKINIQGTRNMVETSIKRKVKKFVLMSSVAAYRGLIEGGSKGVIINESKPKCDETAKETHSYGYSKWQAEEEVRKGNKNGLNTVIVQPGYVIGKYDIRAISNIIRMVYYGKLQGAFGGEGGFTDVSDVSKACIQAFVKGKNGEEYVLGGRNGTLERIMNHTAKILKKPKLKVIPFWQIYGYTFLQTACTCLFGKPRLPLGYLDMIYTRYSCDSTKAIKQLDYKPTKLETIVENYLKWLIKTYPKKSKKKD